MAQGGSERLSAARTFGVTALAGLALGGLLSILEWVVLVARLPVEWSPALAGLMLRNVLLYCAAGLAAGVLAGAAALVLARLVPPLSRALSGPAGAWALLLPGWLVFYWVHALNVALPLGARDPRLLAADAVALVAGVLVAAALLRRAARSARRGVPVVVSLVLLAVLWLPFYAAVAGRSGERIDGGPDLSRVEIGRERAALEGVAGSPSVLLIVLDTTRIDCLGCYGSTECRTPNIDRLAAGSLLFEHAVTPEPLTRPAVSTMLTGLYPRTHGVDTNTKSLDASFVTLAEALREQGYATGAFVAASVLSGYYGTDQGFDSYLEPTEATWELSGLMALKRLYVSLFAHSRWSIEIPAEEVTRRAVTWLRANGDRPYFAVVHYFDPHYPYEPPPGHDLAAAEGLSGVPAPYRDPQDRFRPGFEMPADFRRMMWRRYHGEIEYVDDQVGGLLDAVDATGAAGGTLVVLVTDHGESFEKDFPFAHGNRLFDTLVSVGMMFRFPGRLEPGRVSSQVGLVDLYPTVLSLLDVPSGEAVQGEVIAGVPGAPAADRPVFLQTDFENPKPLSSRVSTGVRLPPWKYVESPELGLVELYDLSSDPGELVDISSERPDVVGEMSSLLKEWLASTERRDAPGEELSPERLEALRALGYVQ